MLYADDAGVVSELAEQSRKMMRVIVVMCTAFGLVVSEAKTEIDVFTHERDAGGHCHIQLRGSWPGLQQNERVRIPRRGRQPKRRPVHRGRLAQTQHMVQLSEVSPRTVRPTERSPRAQNLDAKRQSTRDNAVRLPHVEPTRVPLRHAAPSEPTTAF